MNDPQTRHVIALSGGKDSTAMALRLHELHPNREYIRVVTPTGDELPDMYAHWRRLADMLGPLTVVTADTTLDGLIDRHKMLPNFQARWCTRQLKIEPYQAWILRHTPAVSYVGLRADEENRPGMEFRELSGVDLRFPMQEWGWSLSEVLAYLERKGIEIPKRTDCGSCFFQTLGEWWGLWKDHRDKFDEYAAKEREISEIRGKKCTLRSDGRDSWPADLASLAIEFEKGNTPKGADQTDLFKRARCRVCSM